MIPRKDTKAGAKEVSKVIEEPKGRPKGQGLGRLQGNAPRLRKQILLDQKPKTQLDSSKGSFSKSLRPIELGKQQQTLLDQMPKTHPHSYTAARRHLIGRALKVIIIISITDCRARI